MFGVEIDRAMITNYSNGYKLVFQARVHSPKILLSLRTSEYGFDRIIRTTIDHTSTLSWIVADGSDLLENMLVKTTKRRTAESLAHSTQSETCSRKRVASTID